MDRLMKNGITLGLLMSIVVLSGCIGGDEQLTSTSTIGGDEQLTSTSTIGGDEQLTSTSTVGGVTQSSETGEVREFEMTAFNWGFNPETITVNKGDTVVLHITSTDVAHGLYLPAFGINERLEPGDDVNIEFVADKTGTFTYACSVSCGSGHGEMQGTLVVE